MRPSKSRNTYRRWKTNWCKCKNHILVAFYMLYAGLKITFFLKKKKLIALQQYPWIARLGMFGINFRTTFVCIYFTNIPLSK